MTTRQARQVAGALRNLRFQDVRLYPNARHPSAVHLVWPNGLLEELHDFDAAQRRVIVLAHHLHVHGLGARHEPPARAE